MAENEEEVDEEEYGPSTSLMYVLFIDGEGETLQSYSGYSIPLPEVGETITLTTDSEPGDSTEEEENNGNTEKTQGDPDNEVQQNELTEEFPLHELGDYKVEQIDRIYHKTEQQFEELEGLEPPFVIFQIEVVESEQDEEQTESNNE